MKKLLLILPLILASCGLNTSPGSGQKIGQIVKLTKVGMVSETYEAQLIRGGIQNGSGVMGMTPFNFTVRADQAPLVKQYLENQTEVIIEYKTRFVYSLLDSESGGDFLVTIHPAKE